MQSLTLSARTTSQTGIPLPIVTLNRWTLLAGITAGFLMRQPLITTALFFMVLGAVALGPRGSLVFQVGRRLFARRIRTAEREDRGLMRFNNSIALLLLGGAQVSFLFGMPALGWTLALLVAVAAGVALAGFCLGCFLYFQFKLQRYRLLGGR